MPFQYEGYRSPFANSIAELMLRRGDIAARAAEQSGNAWAGAAQNIGQAVAAIPGQIQQAKRADTIDQLNALTLKQAQQEQAGQEYFDTLQRGDTLPAGVEGPRQQSYLTPDGLNDIPKLNEALNRGGFGHVAPHLLKSAEAINASILQHQEFEQKTGEAQTVLFGDAADGARKLAKATGIPIVNAMDLVVQPLLATKRIQPQQYQQLRGQIAQLAPDQQDAALGTFMDAAAKLAPTKTLGTGAVEHDRYGRPVASNVAPEKPKFQSKTALLDGKPVELSFDENTGKYFQNGSDVTGRVQPYQGPKALQSKSVLVDGKPVEAVFDPTAGTLSVNGVDVTAKAKPIPAAAITIHNQNAQAPDLPAWALDDSRPTGPTANHFDAKTRMTPNGLYQAAVTYIATGQFPQTGRGGDPTAVAQRAAVTSKVGAIAAASGMDEPALRAFYKANGASLAQQQKSLDAVQGFMATADKNADLLEKTLAKIPDTGVPAFNGSVRALSQKFAGNSNVSQFAIYLQSIQNEYARIISQPNLAGQLTDSARKEAEALIKPDATVKQIIDSLQALRNEGTNRLVSIGDQIQRIQQRMTVGPGGAGAQGQQGNTQPIKVGGFTVVVK